MQFNAYKLQTLYSLHFTTLPLTFLVSCTEGALNKKQKMQIHQGSVSEGEPMRQPFLVLAQLPMPNSYTHAYMYPHMNTHAVMYPSMPRRSCWQHAIGRNFQGQADKADITY